MPSPGDSGSAVRRLQQALADAGFDPGPIDGIYGPKTEAAVTAYQDANGLTIDGIAGPQTLGSLGISGSGGGGSGGGSGSSGGSSGIDQEIAERYPHLMWAMDHPELGDILRQAAEEEWDGLVLQGAIQGTDWWQETSSVARQMLALKETDPAEWERRREQMELTVTGLRDQLGIRIKRDQIRQIVDDSLMLGLSEVEIRHSLLDAGRIGISRLEAGKEAGASAEILRQIEQISQDNLIQIDDGSKERWIRDILSGSQTLEGFANYAETVIAAQMPFLQSFIDKGVSPGQALAPYKNEIARQLEMAPESVDWSNERYQKVIRVDNDAGESRLATVAEMKANVRNVFAKEWANTGSAKRSAADFVSRLGAMFGKVA